MAIHKQLVHRLVDDAINGENTSVLDEVCTERFARRGEERARWEPRTWTAALIWRCTREPVSLSPLRRPAGENDVVIAAEILGCAMARAVFAPFPALPH